MTRIVAGRFQTSAQADHAVRMLAAKSVARNRMSVFYVMPPGQHDATPVGGDQHKSPGLEKAEGGAGVAGAAGGVAAGAAGALICATAGLAAPVVAVAALGAAAAGAYGGSLVGAMGASEDPGKQNIRHAGMMVAVDAGTVDADVVSTLRESGAIDIEEAEGVWAEGAWEDFDPTAPPHLVDGPRPHAAHVANPAA
jgi:hypothetical protein